MSRAPDSDTDDSNSKEEDLAQAMYGGAGRQWGTSDETSDEGDTNADAGAKDVVDQHEDVYVYECEIPDCDDAKRERFDEDHQVPDEIWEHCGECGRDTFHRRRDLTDDSGSCSHESVGLTGSDTNGDTVSEQYSCTDCGADLNIHVDFTEEEAWMEVEDDD